MFPWRVRRQNGKPVPRDVRPQGFLRAWRPGEAASTFVFWSNWCGRRAPTSFRIRLADGSTVSARNGVGAPRCDVPHGRSTFGVSRFLFQAKPYRGLPLPLRAAIVDGEYRRLRARRGKVFRYRVRLTNESSKPFRFHQCPAYVQQVGDGRSDARILNCGALQALGPNGSAVFEMRVRIPRTEHERTGIFWQLAPQRDGPDASALIEVR
jgi:hypothetical protein